MKRYDFGRKLKVKHEKTFMKHKKNHSRSKCNIETKRDSFDELFHFKTICLHIAFISLYKPESKRFIF